MDIKDIPRNVIDIIPRFNGEPDKLAIFIDTCEYVIRLYADIKDYTNPINSFLLRLIISKLDA